MKTLLLSLALVTPALAQTAPGTTAPTPNPSPATFDWKLRLTKGQTWTQTFEARGTMTQVSPPSQRWGRTNARFHLQQTLTLHNEVLFANPDFLVLRATFTRFDQTTSMNFEGHDQQTPDRSKFTRAFVGVPFKIKRALDGRVLAVSGLEPLVAGGQKSLDALAKSKEERDKLQRFLPDVDSLRGMLEGYLSFPFPASRFEVGASRVYDFEAYPSFTLADKIKVKRTLGLFDGQVARLSERGTFKVSKVQIEPEDHSQTFISSTGTLSGQTIVSASTGLPHSEVAILINNKISNVRRTTLVSHEDVHIIVSMNLEEVQAKNGDF
jgi:hypothetical protein